MEYFSLYGGAEQDVSATSNTNNNTIRYSLIATLVLSMLFIIISLATIPGTVYHSQKYVKKDTDQELELKDVGLPVTLLSFSIFILLISSIGVFFAF